MLKVTLLAIAFCPAIPLLLPFACFFLALSYAIDRYNLLRVLKPPPQTSDRAVTTAVLYILPIACCAHVFYALFFFSKQVMRGPTRRPNRLADVCRLKHPATAVALLRARVRHVLA